MGNSVCTSSVPISLDDIFPSEHTDTQHRVSSDCEHIPTATLERYERYQHTFIAFSFRHSSKPRTLAARLEKEPKGPGLTEQVAAEPLDLSQPKVWLEESGVYLLLHVQRVPAAQEDSACTARNGLRESDAERYGDDQAPPWAALLGEVFTPRGLASTFATSIGNPTLVTPRTRDECEMRYSLHMLNGSRASPLVSTISVLYALRLERCLSSSKEALRRVFFNDAARANPNTATPVGPVPIGEIATRRAAQHPRLRQHSQRLSEAYAQNAILRILHRVRARPAMPPVIAFPASARGTSSRNATPTRGITPRGRVSTPTCPGSYVFYKSPTHPSGASAQCSQGPPVLEIPKLRFSQESARVLHTDAPLTAQRRSATYAPWATHREGNRSSSNLTSSRTPHTTGESPRLPVITNLRLNEQLHSNTNTPGPVASERHGEEMDEIRMTEERLQKLKAASPEVTEILPWLFVGGEEAAKDRSQLLEKGITSVVNTVAFSIGSLHEDVFRYMGLSVSDSPDEPIFSLFPIVIRFVEETRAAGGKAFIHCHQGVSRSCSFVIAYVMWQQGMCYDRAYEFVRSRRTVCSPNAGFYVNLLLWESNLAKPVLNKAYAFLPYAEYLFPFSFRLALVFRVHQKAHDDDDALVVYPSAQTVYENSVSYILDPRLSYGIILGDSSTPCSGGRTPTIASYFFANDIECDQVVQQQARNEWESFILHNFYQGPVKTTWNDKGECITFSPLPPLAKPTEAIQSLSEFARVIDENVFGVQRAIGDTSPRSKPVLSHDRCWDTLLARGDMLSCFANHVVEEQRMKLATFSRKRRREEERRRLARLVATTPRLSPRAASAASAHSPRGGPVAAQSHSNTTAAAATKTAAAAGISTPSSRGGVAPSLLSVPSSPTERQCSPRSPVVEVYAYPFNNAQLADIIDAGDLESDGCYAIVVPCAAAMTGKAHKVFLWFGLHCGISEEDGWETYRRALCTVKGVRLFSGEVLKSPVEETVYEGEEPDELLLALD